MVGKPRLTLPLALLCAQTDLEGQPVTFRPDGAREPNNIMRGLVVLFIAWVAYWASTGGLARMMADDATTAILRSVI